MNDAYTIRTEFTGYDFGVHYILEQDSKQLLKIKGSSLYHTYALIGDIETLKGVMYATNHGVDVPKAAIDYFVEETYKMFDLKRIEKRNSLFAKGSM